MELRHLRCFLAVASELHFARAAERLHIEQSPLSRAIKELEEDLGVKLFVRTTRSTRLTHAGKLFQEHVPRVFTALQQARDSVKAAANGFHGQLRVALSDGITPSRFSTFLALCRQEEPEIEIRLSEVPLTQQIKGLHDDLYDVGFAQSDEVGDGVGDPLACEGHARQVDRALRRVEQEPLIAERVTTIDLMMALVSAGFALGLAGASQIAASREPGVVARPLAGRTPMLTTYLLRLDGEPSQPLARFIERVSTVESSGGQKPSTPSQSDPSEEPET